MILQTEFPNIRKNMQKYLETDETHNFQENINYKN